MKLRRLVGGPLHGDQVRTDADFVFEAPRDSMLAARFGITGDGWLGTVTHVYRLVPDGSLVYHGQFASA